VAVIFDVLTYNVKMAEAGLDADLGDLSVTRLKNAKRAKAILAEIVGMEPRPDVVVFTELFARKARDILVEGPRESVWFAQVGPRSGGLRDHGYEVTERPGEDELRNGGVLIASRHPIERSGSRTFGYYAGGSGPLQQAKGVVHAAVDVCGVTHHVFGTHLQSGCGDRELDARRTQIDALGWFADRRTPASGREPVVIAGDFNVGNEQTGRCATLTVRELRGRLESAGLDVREPGDPPVTTLGGEDLDHVFNAGPSLWRGRYERLEWFRRDGLPERVFGGRRSNGEKVVFLSDHHPLLASFDFRLYRPIRRAAHSIGRRLPAGIFR
jgi:endonuclease/exonuclease/phosphatase family metal-dependent hydrolase